MIFVKVGMDVCWDGVMMGFIDMINEGVCCGYMYLDNVLCVLIVNLLEGVCKNIKDNMLVVIYYEIVLGDKVDV